MTKEAELYKQMLRIRRFEEAVGELHLQGKIQTPCHLSIGQEAVAVGVCSLLRLEDAVFGTHRSHHHYLAKGGNIKKLLAEICCKSTGCTGGRGGSMHITAPEVGFMGTSAIVGGSIPLAVGVALAFSCRTDPWEKIGEVKLKYPNGNEESYKRSSNYFVPSPVAVAFFGEGAACEGVFYESMNFASLKKLPVLFVCENNLYCSHLHVSQIHARPNIYKKAEAFNMPGGCVDGNNVIQVQHITRWALDRARRGDGPTLIECLTYRWRGHVGPHEDLDKPIRPKKEVEEWKKHCPIKKLGKQLSVEECLKVGVEVELEIMEAIEFVEEA